MAHRFIVDDSPPSSPAPPMPEHAQTPQRNLGYSRLGDCLSTTPAGRPPPSSAASFTPAGEPSYLGSSMFQPQTGQQSVSFGGGFPRNITGTNLFGYSDKPNAPLGRSIIGSQRQPSGLSQQFNADDMLPEDIMEESNIEGEDYSELPPGSMFRNSFAPGGFGNTALDNEIDRVIEEEYEYEEEHERERRGGYEDEEGEEDEDREESEAADNDDYSDQEDAESIEQSDKDLTSDMFLNMRHDDRPFGKPLIGEESDLMMLNTPAANRKIRKEAEDIFRRSLAHLSMSNKRSAVEFGTIARKMYMGQDVAQITESSRLILDNENLVSRLYNEGVGAEEDENRLRTSLANTSERLIWLWRDFVDNLPRPEGEAVAGIGPDARAEPLQKAAFIAEVVLLMHHSRPLDEEEEERSSPLPEILLDWMKRSHNLYPDQIRVVRDYRPSPACHSLFWQTVRSALLRGQIGDACSLLRTAGWENVRRGASLTYTGQALEHVRGFTSSAYEVLEKCPGMREDWDICNNDWTLFRIHARGFYDRMTLFAEGVDEQFRNSVNIASPKPQALSTMARKATSQLPWEVYEQLQTIYGILLGKEEAIMDTAQDWCEATIGMFAWWDDGSPQYNNILKPSHATRSLFGASRGSSTPGPASSEDYFERLSSALHQVTQSDLVPNALNPVEVALVSAFEGNVEAVIGFLRMWSMPLACAVAEIASLGHWLPQPQPTKPSQFEGLDIEDLAVLNYSPPTADDVQGIKDSTLEVYARQLAGIDQLDMYMDGWEMAIMVLGRMDGTEKSEETVGELLRDLLKTLDEKSAQTVDKMWKLLNDLGMMNFAEETAETFADILSEESHRYGEALWYYALSHRAEKVHNVLNLLISYSLIQSTAYPAEKDLDQELKNLLRHRTKTLEERGNQDLEAAQLLGRMLSGYATLRKFYELRDEHNLSKLSPAKALAVKKQAAFALIAVISSADDNIRGGLYDETRDVVVSEDFLLALLGEATVFVNQPKCVISLEQMDILLKAIEDIQTIGPGSRVYNACEEFFNVTLSSAQGLKGSTPADLMKTMTGNSFVLGQSTMLANHLQKSMAAAAGGSKVHREWDWRKQWMTTTKAKDVLGTLRLGLARDLATLWLQDADGVCGF